MLVAEITNTLEYWANWGVAGAILFVLGASAAYIGRQWWLVEKPRRVAAYQQALEHAAAKQQMDLEREKKTVLLLTTLTESQIADIEFKRRQINLLEKVDDRQGGHAEVCHQSHKLIEEIHRKIIH